MIFEGVHKKLSESVFRETISLTVTHFGTSAVYSRQLCLCPFPAYSAFSAATSFPSMKWSETCTTTLILLISVSFETIWGGGCNMHFYPHFYI